MSPRLDVILIGPPGAGKGTQASRFSQREGLTHLSTGDLLRQAIAARTDVGLRVKAIVEAGGLAADELVLELVEARLGGVGDSGILFDGFPRTIRQAELLADLFSQRSLAPPVVIEIRVPADDLIRRLTSRRTCSRCGPRPAGETVCGGCGQSLSVRADDSEEVARERLQVYEAQTAPLIAHYTDSGLLEPVDGLGDPEDIAARIASIVGGDRGREGPVR